MKKYLLFWTSLALAATITNLHSTQETEYVERAYVTPVSIYVSADHIYWHHDGELISVGIVGADEQGILRRRHTLQNYKMPFLWLAL
jgi:hypothetical protein